MKSKSSQLKVVKPATSSLIETLKDLSPEDIIERICATFKDVERRCAVFTELVDSVSEKIALAIKRARYTLLGAKYRDELTGEMVG